jgi:CHAT domain-containing protein
LERALRIREHAFGPQHPDVAETLGSLGYTLHQAGDATAARPLYERALRIQEDALGPDHADTAATLHNFGHLLVDLGDLQGGRHLLERALKIRERTLGANHVNVARTLGLLARALQFGGEYGAARAAAERSVAIRERLGPDHPEVAIGLELLGRLHLATEDLDAARPLLERALRIREQTLGPNHPWVAQLCLDLGHIFRNSGDYASAATLVERALRIREQAFGPNHRSVGHALRDRAWLFFFMRKHIPARYDFERALRILEPALGPGHSGVAQALFGLGRVLQATGDRAGARTALERALGIYRGGVAPEFHWRTATRLAQIHEREGRLEEAAALYREATVTIRQLAGSLEGQLSRARYLEASNRLGVFDALARVLLRLHRRDATKGHELDALSALEAKKTLLVATAMAAGAKVQDEGARRAAEQVQTKRRHTAALERALREEQAKEPAEQHAGRIQALTTQLAQTKAEYLGQVQAFLARYPRFKAQFVEQQTVDPKMLAKFAERLPPGTLAVQYFAAPDALYIFVVAPGGHFQVRTQAIAQPDLYALIKEYRSLAERAATQRLPWADDGSEAYRRNVVPLRDVTERLSAHLLAPIEPELRSHPSLILFPNDLLLYLPIHALTRKQPDGTVRFVAETHVTSYVTQLELVDLFTASRSTPSVALLAVANPDGTLPAASLEVRALRRIRPSLTALEGPAATKARLLSLVSQFPDLHFATHGILDRERPERSYLLLAGEGDAGERLSIGEIAGLSLTPDALTVLSACETALGEEVPGAALITLAAAFSQAGAQSIVASLWKVNDAATRDFMVAFHRELPTAGRAAALQQAQIAVLRNPATAHPYYWAPFILIGGR